MTIKKKLIQNSWKVLMLGISAVFAFSLFATDAEAATSKLYLSPANGSFQVGGTFQVSVLLDTQGDTINTIDLLLRYPPDKLQLVSSGTGNSIIGLWTSQPQYNNQTGVLELTGGVPGGIKVSNGLITTLTFRARAVGSAIVKFDRSRVLLNDGNGTEVLTQNQNSSYELVLPPPDGPTVTSDSHPDQTLWYSNNNVSLKWSEPGAEGFSYIISDNPVEIPDEISEGSKTDIIYRGLGNGRKYFHIRALRSGFWGEASHYAINIDTAPPVDFEPEIIPNARTSRTQPLIEFKTTDELSGVAKYELKLVDVKNLTSQLPEGTEIFVEARSPFVTSELQLGDYDVIIRAYDNAGNYVEVVKRLEIVTPVFRYFSERGIELKSGFVFPWWLVLLVLLILIILIWRLGRRIQTWHKLVEYKRQVNHLPDNLQEQITELQKYRSKYGKLAAIILLVAVSFMGSQVQVRAQQQEDVFDSPLINTVSDQITNEEIFYVGGRVATPNSEIILYLQNNTTAETLSSTVKADSRGAWFYRHDTFLSAGEYVMWAQGRHAGQVSPPSPQVKIIVEEAAVQIGSTRISYASLYLILFAITIVMLTGVIIYAVYHAVHGRRKHELMLKEIGDAQESLRRGFSVLNRDIQAELDVIKRAKLSQKLSIEEKQKEEQLLRDLEDIQQYMTKEIWEIEKAERVN